MCRGGSAITRDRCHRHADRQRQHDRPADHPPAAVRPGQDPALGVAEPADGDRHEQHQVRQPHRAAALDHRERDHRGQAQRERSPVAPARPFAAPPGRHPGRRGGGKARDHRGVHAADLAQGQRREQAEAQCPRSRRRSASGPSPRAAAAAAGAAPSSAMIAGIAATTDRPTPTVSGLNETSAAAVVGEGQAEAHHAERAEQERCRFPQCRFPCRLRSASIVSHE